MFCERSSRTSSSPVGKGNKRVHQIETGFENGDVRMKADKEVSGSYYQRCNHCPEAIVVSETSKISCTPYLKLQGH